MIHGKRLARCMGYLDAIEGKESNPGFFPPAERFAYRTGYADGQAIKNREAGQ